MALPLIPILWGIGGGTAALGLGSLLFGSNDGDDVDGNQYKIETDFSGVAFWSVVGLGLFLAYKTIDKVVSSKS